MLPFSNHSVGQGPKRAVARYLINDVCRADESNWKVNDSEYLIPVIASWRSTTRNVEWRIWGTCAALHMAWLQLAPIPISPFLLYLLVRGTLDCDIDFIRFVDPKAAEILRPWFDLSPADALPTNLADRVCTLLIAATGLQV